MEVVCSRPAKVPDKDRIYLKKQKSRARELPTILQTLGRTRSL